MIFSFSAFFCSNAGLAQSKNLWEEAFPEPSTGFEGSVQQGIVGLGEVLQGLAMSGLADINLLEYESMAQILDRRRRILAYDASRTPFDVMLGLQNSLSELKEERKSLEGARANFWREHTTEFGPSPRQFTSPETFASEMRRYNAEISRLEALEAELKLQIARSKAAFDQVFHQAERRLASGTNLTRIEQQALGRELRGRRLNRLLWWSGVLLSVDGATRLLALGDGRNPGILPGINLTATLVKRQITGPSGPVEGEVTQGASAR